MTLLMGRFEGSSGMRQYSMLIDGKWVSGTNDRFLVTENPYTGAAWAKIPRGSADDVDSAVAAAAKAFRDPAWANISASKRGGLLRRFAELVRANAEHLATIETTDNGKLLSEMIAQVRYLPEWFDYFGGLADKIEGRVIPIDKPGVFNFTREEPLGVIAAITPWNSPLMLATWKLAPALAAGNTVVWKPSEFSSVSALEFGKLFKEAGFPDGVINIVTGLGSELGVRLTTHPLVSKVAFTGGDSTGQAVYESAARGIKPVTLELGGKSANIVFGDAELDHATRGVISGIFAASGQTCIAGSRALVHRSIYSQFIESLVSMAKTAKMGDPLELTTQVGPITTHSQYAKVLEYIEIAKREGAKCVLGGTAATRPECGSGWFVEPTIFTDVSPNMRIAQEEVFGPVLSVIPFDDDDEAVAIANGTIYGLAAGIWTQNIQRALSMPERLQAGTVWVNTYRAISYMSPFGGYKRSGLGRESGLSAIREYLQEKSVWIDISGSSPNPFVIR
jgi:aldehyde dehydrogenase (NAD+)